MIINKNIYVLITYRIDSAKEAASEDKEPIKSSHIILEILKKNKLTNELRKIYLDKKNFNTNPNKKSRALYAEAVNEVYNAHH